MVKYTSMRTCKMYCIITSIMTIIRVLEQTHLGICFVKKKNVKFK